MSDIFIFLFVQLGTFYCVVPIIAWLLFGKGGKKKKVESNNDFMQVLPGNLRNAALVHADTRSAREKEAAKTWKYIQDKIDFASRCGEYEVEYAGQIDEHTVKVLKEL